MTLGEFVNTMPDDEILYIGSQSSYVFVGTKEEFWRDVNINSEKHRERINGSIKNAKDAVRLKSLRVIDVKEKITECEEKIAVYEIVIDDLVKQFNETANMPEKERMTIAKGMAQKIEGINKYLEKTKAILSNRKSVLDRLETEIKNAEITIKAGPEKLAKSLSFADREVKSSMKLDISCVDMVGTQIIFDGDELGDFWTDKEYKVGKRC